MTDDHSPLDDDLLSAVLDGEATPEERARVEASPEARQRLERLRAAAGAVARPVDPLDAGVADALLARALAEADADRGAAPVELSAARDGRGLPTARARSWWTRAGVAVGAAAAVVLLVVALAGLVGGGRTDSASDSSAGSGATAASTDERAAAESSADAAAPTDVVGVDLGAVPDAATVLERFATFSASVPAFAHQDESVAGGPATGPPGQSAERATPDPASCAVPPVPVLPGEAWATVARADLPSGPVLVMADRSGGDAARVLVVDVSSCAVLAEGTA